MFSVVISFLAAPESLLDWCCSQKCSGIVAKLCNKFSSENWELQISPELPITLAISAFRWKVVTKVKYTTVEYHLPFIIQKKKKYVNVLKWSFFSLIQTRTCTAQFEMVGCKYPIFLPSKLLITKFGCCIFLS